MKDVIVSFLMFIGLVSALCFFVSIIFDWGIDILLYAWGGGYDN
jgi:hypothetical protein